MRNHNRYAAVILGIILPCIAFMVSLGLGRYPLSLSEVGYLLFHPLSGAEAIDSSTYMVFWHVRFPRTLLVLLCGGALALAGTVLQGIFRNPLVSPDIIGVASGASLGAAIAIVLFSSSPGIIQLLAFLGGSLAALIVFNLSVLTGRDSIVSLILSGIIINSLSSACISLLKYLADPSQQLPALEFWLMGGFYGASWTAILNILPQLLLGSLAIIALRWQVNVLSMGEEEALSLGIPVTAVRAVLIAACTVLVAATVSAAGIISWVGLVAPHIVRMISSNNHQITIPLSFSAGGAMLLLADTLARSLTASEIPVSIITALIGAPFLGYLLWKVGNKDWIRS